MVTHSFYGKEAIFWSQIEKLFFSKFVTTCDKSKPLTTFCLITYEAAFGLENSLRMSLAMLRSFLVIPKALITMV